MRNIKLILEYDGTNYSGWQSQKNAVAIQDVVAQAIEKMVEEKATLVGASRTDAGVHALGQVATFQTARTIPCDGFLKGLNNLLPEDIRIVGCEEASLDFHPIGSAKRKTYRYILGLGEVPSALWRERVWWVGPKLDLQTMEEASRHLIGEHDFKSFQGADSDTRTTVRRLETVIIEDAVKNSGPVGFGTHPPTRIRSEGIDPNPPPAFLTASLTFTGTGFLKHMVRNIVGTLVDIGRVNKGLAPSDMKKILEAKDRTKAGPTAPPHGLYLMHVEY